MYAGTGVVGAPTNLPTTRRRAGSTKEVAVPNKGLMARGFRILEQKRNKGYGIAVIE